MQQPRGEAVILGSKIKPVFQSDQEESKDDFAESNLETFTKLNPPVYRRLTGSEDDPIDDLDVFVLCADHSDAGKGATYLDLDEPIRLYTEREQL
ncbi:hypothetical protein ACVIHH_008263 [Bradyrhizobium sp. USDA 4518]